jgi:hypothetical protein
MALHAGSAGGLAVLLVARQATDAFVNSDGGAVVT